MVSQNVNTAAMTADVKQRWRERNIAKLADNEHFKVLGFDQNEKYILNKASGAIISMRKYSPIKVVQLAPLAWWRQRFPNSKGTRFNRLEVWNFLCRAIERAGRYESHVLDEAQAKKSQQK